MGKSFYSPCPARECICLQCWLQVQTDMGANAAEIAGIKEGPPVTQEQSVNGMLKHIDSATRETSGRFWAWNGEETPF